MLEVKEEKKTAELFMTVAENLDDDEEENKSKKMNCEEDKAY